MVTLHWKVPHSKTSRPAGSMRIVNRSTFAGSESTVMGRRATSWSARYSVPHWPDWPLMMSETPPLVGSVHSVYVPGCSGTPASAIGAEVVSCVAALAPVPGATEMLHLIFDETAYARLQASTINHGKPDNQAPDQQNYAAFAKACSDLIAESPANFVLNVAL